MRKLEERLEGVIKMIKDPGIMGSWIISDKGGVIEASNDLEKLLKRARERAEKSNERVDVVYYVGSFYPKH